MRRWIALDEHMLVVPLHVPIHHLVSMQPASGCPCLQGVGMEHGAKGPTPLPWPQPWEPAPPTAPSPCLGPGARAGGLAGWGDPLEGGTKGGRAWCKGLS
jgi:hypothetical protein